jgi:uncharacterized membrane protein
MQKQRQFSPRERVVVSLAGLTGVSICLFFAGAVANRSLQFDYLLWNLFLAWVPLGIVVLLVRSLRHNLWSSWRPLGLTLLWLVLLPNSFYMISDFVHIQDVARHNLLYDVVMFTAFIFTAALLGFSSLYIVHTELRKRMRMQSSSVVVAGILFLCSFAIYLGRDLRWNSWDVLLNPAGILFDVSDHLIHPWQSGEMFTTTLSFFILLGSLYVVGWQFGEATRQEKQPGTVYAPRTISEFVPTWSSVRDAVGLGQKDKRL